MLCVWRKEKKTKDATRKKQQTEKNPLSVAVIQKSHISANCYWWESESACARDIERPNFEEQYFLHFVFILLHIISEQSFVVGLFQLFKFNIYWIEYCIQIEQVASQPHTNFRYHLRNSRDIFLHHMLFLKFCSREYKQKPWKWNRIGLFTFQFYLMQKFMFSCSVLKNPCLR